MVLGRVLHNGPSRVHLVQPSRYVGRTGRAWTCRRHRDSDAGGSLEAHLGQKWWSRGDTKLTQRTTNFPEREVTGGTVIKRQKEYVPSPDRDSSKSTHPLLA